MKIRINEQTFEIDASPPLLEKALRVFNAVPPFAVAVNGLFVPRSAYAVHVLHEGDQIDVVRPVVGG